MAERLSREVCADLRAKLHDGVWSPSCDDLQTILAVLDAYEAQPYLLREVARSGVDLDDPRIGYVTVQIDRETWQAIRERDDG